MDSVSGILVKRLLTSKEAINLLLVFTFLSPETNEKVSVIACSLGMYGDSILQRNLLSW